MIDRRETCAGGVVCRRGAMGLEVVVGTQCDRLTGADTTRLPKGRLETRESREDAARREVAEETGLEVRLLAPLSHATYCYEERGDRIEKEVHFFLMEAAAGDFGKADGELRELGWCPIDQALERLTYENEREAVSRARELAGQVLAR